MTRLFETGATRDTDTTKLDYEGFLSPRVLKRYAEYMHECRLRNIPPGQELRSSDNWQKGIPTDAYMKSMLRHVMDVWIGHRDGFTNRKWFEDALCAILFNVQGYLFELDKEKHGKTNDPVGSGGGNLSGMSVKTSIDQGDKAVLEMPRGEEEYYLPYIPGCDCQDCTSRKLRSESRCC